MSVRASAYMSSDEDDLPVAGSHQEGGNALHAVDQRIKVVLLDFEKVH